MTTEGQIKAELVSFFSRHQTSSLENVKDESGGLRLAVTRPWDDGSVQIVIPPERSELIDVLNRVLLPERLTAIYHPSLRALEVIWTTYQPRNGQEDIPGRRWVFRFKNEDHVCEFSSSSSELLCIAINSEQIQMTETAGRNLSSYKQLLMLKSIHQGEMPPFFMENPLSFWISNLGDDEDSLIEIVNHLNFYISYFDTISPTIIVHPTKVTSGRTLPRARYVNGTFPHHINAREIDINILHYWQAAQIGDSSRRLIYCYRVIE